MHYHYVFDFNKQTESPLIHATNVDATTNFSVSLERSDLMSLHSSSMLKYK